MTAMKGRRDRSYNTVSCPWLHPFQRIVHLHHHQHFFILGSDLSGVDRVCSLKPVHRELFHVITRFGRRHTLSYSGSPPLVTSHTPFRLPRALGPISCIHSLSRSPLLYTCICPDWHIPHFHTRRIAHTLASNPYHARGRLCQRLERLDDELDSSTGFPSFQHTIICSVSLHSLAHNTLFKCASASFVCS